jgi:uncharacterized protein
MKPKKVREVFLPPKVVFFKPQGKLLRDTKIINLNIDEYEAIRLADYEKLNHYESSKMMNISRPTFTRLLESAHNKISSAIVEGKGIKIEGGEFKFSGRVFQCNQCGQFQYLKNEEDSKRICSNCNSDDLKEVYPESFRRFRRGRWKY